MKFMVETSARHIHLTQESVEKLFGAGHQLQPRKNLSYPGIYACHERLTVVGPKRSIENISVLGPCRTADQLQLLVLHGAVAVFAQRIALRGQSLKIHRISPFPRAAVSPASFVVAPL